MHVLSELTKAGLINKTENEDIFIADKITLVDTPAIINVKVLDPGQILLGKLSDQSRHSLELKKVVEF